MMPGVLDQLTNDLFLDEVDNSLITLHTLANPAAYGITDYDKTLGTVSLEDTKQALNDAKSLKVQLNEMTAVTCVRTSCLHITSCPRI